MKATLNILLLFLLTTVGSKLYAQHESKPYKITERQWDEITDGFKRADAYKNTDARWAVEVSKEVLGGKIISKRTIYSNSSCNCILLVITYNKGEPLELVDYLFKYKKHYSWDGKKWRFEKRVDRVGYSRCK